MALRPEPIDEVLPAADAVVVGEVVSVDVEVPASREPRPVGAGPGLPEQRATLRVERCLKGARAGDVVVVKPPSTYVLSRGARGVFVLDASSRILGRYGPDTWTLATVERALQAR